MSRLVAVSNRVGPLRGAPQAGGLAVGLYETLKQNHGLWFGWSGRVRNAVDDSPSVTELQGVTAVTLDLTTEEYDLFYGGFANRCLWPLFHFRLDLLVYEPRFLEAYFAVNQRYAQALAGLLQPDDTLWVHDYHLIPLATCLRALGVHNRIGFFLHTPFPPHDILAALPQHTRLGRSLFDYDLVGFQTEADLRRFHEYVLGELYGRVHGGQAVLAGARLQTGAFPIGINPLELRAMSFSPRGTREFELMQQVLRGRAQIIGVDRLDYSKGLLRRMHAFELLLETQPDTHGQLDLLQIAPISRGELKAYSDFRQELEQAAVHINSRYAQVDWTPVRYVTRAISRRALAGLYRASRIGLVTPMRDGMNLVAKEYVAAQDSADPGVLILSRFAGAAAQMPAALLINPYDSQEIAQAIQQARGMSLAERRSRHAELWRGLLRHNAQHWADSFLGALRAVPRHATYAQAAVT